MLINYISLTSERHHLGKEGKPWSWKGSVHMNLCRKPSTEILMAALFIIAQTGHNPNAHRWWNGSGRCFRLTREYDTAIKRNKKSSLTAMAMVNLATRWAVREVRHVYQHTSTDPKPSPVHKGDFTLKHSPSCTWRVFVLFCMYVILQLKKIVTHPTTATQATHLPDESSSNRWLQCVP